MDEQGWTDDQGEVHQWGRFTVTIFLNGRNFVLKLSDLSEESQALARKLSAPPAPASTSPAKTPSSSGVEPSPPPSTVKTVGSGGKFFLPTLGSGKWASYHSVLETATHDVGLHGSGVFHLYLKEGSENLLQGRPLVLNFNHGYYSKTHPKASVYAYHTSRSDHHYHYRKITGFESPPEPSEKLGRLKLKAELEDGVTLEIGFEASSRRIAIWGKADDPSSVEHPTVLALRCPFRNPCRSRKAMAWPNGSPSWTTPPSRWSPVPGPRKPYRTLRSGST